MKIPFAFIAAIAAFSTYGATYVSPVATAKVKDRVFSTTTAFRNDGQRDVSCEATYSGPKIGQNGTLRVRYEIPAGKTVTEEDTLMEVGAIGTMRFVCSDAVVIAARIQTSSDEGATFDLGRVFPAESEANAVTTGTTFAVSTSTDLLVMEVAGKGGDIDVLVKDSAGVVLGKRRYDLPPFGQRVLNLSKILTQTPEVKVQIRLAAEGGKLAIAKPTNDPALLMIAQRMPSESRARFNAHRAERARLATASVDTTGPSITEQLLISPFKAAPFREPATGLAFMRDRWYEPSTGTFLTPDPEGYDDSSNPYIFGKGDPVNNSDPTGRHTFVKRSVNGLEFELLAPDPDEVRKGILGMSGAFVNPFTGRRETFSWDQHQSELLLMQARWGNPLMRDAFAQFFGMSHDQVDVSGLRLYWNSLWHHKTDIALSAGFTIAMLAPRPPVPAVRTTPQVNLMRGSVTPPSGATSTLVEGGGLAAHESAGGHLIERHVGQTPAQLRARLAAEPRVPAVSTFMDRAVAESAVNTTLQANQAQIASWMRSASTRPLVLNHTLARPTGLSLPRGAVTPTTVSGVRLVLVKDATMPMGYRVHTGFPTP